MYLKSSSPDNRTDAFLKPSSIRLATPSVTRLFEDILNRDLNLRVRVTGMSMTPFIRDGDIVIIRKMPYFLLKTGDLIFFKNRQGLPTVHRIIRKRRTANNVREFFTKGDAMISFDELISVDEVLGKICKIEKTGSPARSKTRDLESPLWRILNPAIALMQRIRSAFLIRTMSLTLYYIFVIRL